MRDRYRITKKEMYRDWAWQIFQNTEKYAKTKYGYGQVINVNAVNEDNIEDKMESYFFAETLKYHYLIQVRSPFLSRQLLN